VIDAYGKLTSASVIGDRSTSPLHLRHLLRSADANKLLVPRSCTTSFEPRSFGFSDPTAWNDMPAQQRNLDLSLNDFRQLLKTALFQTVSV